MFSPLSHAPISVCCCGLGSNIRCCWHNLGVYNPFADAICTMMDSQQRDKRACAHCRADPCPHHDSGPSAGSGSAVQCSYTPWHGIMMGTGELPLQSPGCWWGCRSLVLPLNSCFNIGTSKLPPKEDKAPVLPKMAEERGNNFLWKTLSYAFSQPYSEDISSPSSSWAVSSFQNAEDQSHALCLILFKVI